jgi:ATP-dependent exoDNAse (exonuclease V) beta subunit
MTNPAFSVYNASAGSGKTFTLTKEYLIKLFKSAKDDGYKNILAITFTNKAVNEMKSRILKALYAFTQNTYDEKTTDLLLAIQEKEPTLKEVFIREKSKRIIKHLLHEYSSFDVLTIDKFTHKLIRSFAQNLEFTENFEVIVDQDDLLNQAIARVMAKVGEDESLTQIVLDFAKDKTDENKSWDVTYDLKVIAKQLTKEAFKNDIDALKNISLTDYHQIKKELIAKRNQIQSEVKAVAQNILETFENLGITAEAFDRGNFFNFFLKNLSELQPPSESLIKKNANEEFYKKSANKNQKATIDSIALDIKAAVEQINQQINRFNLCINILNNMTPMALLQNISEEMTIIQEEENSKLLSSFNHVIQTEIQNQPALFLYEKLGSKYFHYFIDEFQDTSNMQWENLIPLIDNTLSGEYIPGQSGTLMIVGDPKQAIYRFRNGDAEQFIKLSDDLVNPFSNKEKTTFNLDTNWRSYHEVIDFNNQFFAYISQKFNNELYKNLYKNNSFQKSNKNKGGFVQIRFLNENNFEDNQDEEELIEDTIKNGHAYFKLVLNTIRDLEKKGYKHKDIAVLVNKNEQGNFIAQQLIANDIKIISPDALKLNNSPEVNCVISLLKYMINPDNNEEKLNFLILLKTILFNKFEWTIEEKNLLSSKKLDQLSLYLQHLNIDLKVEQLLNLSLFDGVEKIIKGLFSKLQSNAYLQYFLDLVYEKNIKQQIGIIDFISHWDEKATSFLVPTPADNDAVQIMSIHKSKGLEFPIVIYPFATENISNRLGRDDFFVTNPIKDIALPVLLMKASKAFKDFDESFESIYYQKEEQVKLDMINVIYVALTRAVEHLYIFTEANFVNDKENKGEKKLSANTSGNFYAEYVLSQGGSLDKFEIGQQIKFNQKKEENQAEEDLVSTFENMASQAIKIAQKEALLWDTKQQEAIAFGNILHQLMQDIYKSSDVDKVIEKNLLKGVIASNEAALFTSKINEIINHPDLIKFYKNTFKVYNERALINDLGELLIPDKVVFHNDKEFSILDFKTGEKLSAHQNQINHYTKALTQMGYTLTDQFLVYVGENLVVEKV